MLINRHLGTVLKKVASTMPVIAITGPRQSGKTTLVRNIFEEHIYANLENPETRQYAKDNPAQFLSQHKKGLIIDEAQHLPELFSYIMLHVDDTRRNGEIIVTGSQNFNLLENITQSLAGRVAIFNLLPFSYSEIKGADFAQASLFEFIYKGMYPRLYDQNVPPEVFYPSYIQSYIQRDVRQVQNIGDLHAFEKFLHLCAGRVGQLFNQSNLATEVGVSVPTIRRWMSILQTGFVAFLLPPYFRHFNKRILKTPKLFFYDTGLVCSLLRIRSAEELDQHYARGALFENFIIVEMLKQQLNLGRQQDLYYWKDNTGYEIDLLVPQGNKLNILEIKSATRLHPDFFKNLEFFQKLTKTTSGQSYLIYAGEEQQERTQGYVRGWKHLPLIG